jgi:uncharacterized alkaline shock family protein YloU
MKFFKALFVLVFSLVTLIVGVLLIAYAMGNPFLYEAVERYNLLRLDSWLRGWVGVAGAVFVSTFLLWMIMINRSRRRRKFVPIKKASGNVMISIDAIESYIYRAGKEFAEIKELIPRVKAHGSGVSVVIEVIFLSDTNIPQITDEFQRTIKSHLTKVLGISRSVRIKLIISELGYGRMQQLYDESVDVSEKLITE